MENTISEMKNTPDEIKSRVEAAGIKSVSWKTR